MRRLPFLILAVLSLVSQVWVADRGDGTYKNPILYADYSDPDASRVGEDYYLVSSSFDAVPGLPILHSKDLVNRELLAHVYDAQPPYDVFNKTQHGNGASFMPIGEPFQAKKGRWIGAKVGLFAIRNGATYENGYAD